MDQVYVSGELSSCLFLLEFVHIDAKVLAHANEERHNVGLNSVDEPLILIVRHLYWTSC